MKKVFISIPMRDRERSDILSAQGKILASVNEKLGEPVMLIETYLDGETAPLEALGENLKRMANADLAVFAEDWDNARDCFIEYVCASKYGIPILDL